jgi:hypothetical protein
MYSHSLINTEYIYILSHDMLTIGYLDLCLRNVKLLHCTQNEEEMNTFNRSVGFEIHDHLEHIHIYIHILYEYYIYMYVYMYVYMIYIYVYIYLCIYIYIYIYKYIRLD